MDNIKLNNQSSNKHAVVVSPKFNIGDIVRSGFVKEYLIEKTKLGFGVDNEQF